MSVFADKLRQIFSISDPKHALRFVWLGGFVGAASAVVAIFFRETISLAQDYLFAPVPEGMDFWEVLSSIPPWQLMMIPIVCGGFVAWFTRKFAPEAEGHGVPEIMDAVATNRGVIRPRVTLVKLISSTISIGSGFSVGREGPTALIGATIGSWFGQVLKFPLGRMKMIVGAGSAAGIAATFNAPLAGTAFALELIVGNFSVRYMTPIILSAMLATVITHKYFGDTHPLFLNLQYDIAHPTEILLYAGLGVLAGLVGVIFTRTLYGAEDLAAKIKLPVFVKGAIGGLGIGAILVAIPELTGPATWDAIHLPLEKEMSWRIGGVFLALCAGKLLATSWSLATGASGGIFAPSLMIGGSLGAAYGFVVGKLLPGFTEEPSGYAMVGMGALVAGVTQAPLTAVTIIFELTNNTTIVLPLIVACALALGTYNRFHEASIYTKKLQRRGIYLEWGRETGILESLLVSKIAVNEDEYFFEQTPLILVIDHFTHSTRSTLPVVSRNFRLLGVISFWDIRDYAHDEKACEGKTAADVMNKRVQFVRMDENLYRAFSLISSGDFEYLPVVDNEYRMTLAGGLHRHQLLQIYKNQLTIRGIIRPEITGRGEGTGSGGGQPPS